MYTDAGDTPLGEILDRVYKHFDGKEVDYKHLQNEGKLADTFGEIIPDFDRTRVYDSDIRKLFTWYNLLVKAGFTSFAIKDDESEEHETEEGRPDTTEPKPDAEVKK